MDIARIVLYLVPLVLSLTFHEFAHAAVARMLGDDTAQRAGRLTLNPIAHVDVIGTLVIPAVAIMFGGLPLIGWAKPTPVDASRFRRGIDRRRGNMLVSAAGPLSNLLLALIAAAILALGGETVRGNRGVSELLGAMLWLNVGLCVFNFLPIPPLDGSRLLPRSLDGVMRRIQPFSMLVLMGILMFPPASALLVRAPIALIMHGIGSLFGLQFAPS